MLHLSASCQYYLYRKSTDMRKGFDSLCGLVNSCMHVSPLNGAVFIFFNRKRNQVKLLYFEGDGFSVYHKRLETGTYELPSPTSEAVSLSVSAEQLHLVLSGISLKHVRHRKRYQHPPVISG